MSLFTASRLPLLLLGVVLAGCSAQKTAEEWTGEYHRHANLVKATAVGHQQILEVDSVASCVIPGVVFWPYTGGPWIARVNPVIARADVRAGDRIVAVNGKYVKHLGVLLLRLSRLARNDRLVLTLSRNHELLRVHTRCEDSTAVFEATAKALGAAARGDWRQCLQLATDLPSITQVHYSWVAELRFNCNEAERLRDRRQPNAHDATLAHEWARLRLEEAKDIPEGIARVRWGVIETIYWLQRHRFDHLATDLSDHLDAYSPHRW